ncbi:hypothetical protein ACFYUY_05965 [Kitasatospora sp. NPDC004745]|uniref:hypothetical protein n=1 Tax=unclassified Kitasatospora TaxID=2633591 RepID=UPI00340237D7
MDLETTPRRGRRAMALAGLALAAAVTVTGCNGDGKSASDAAPAGATASASASGSASPGPTASPQAPTPDATPPSSAPVTAPVPASPAPQPTGAAPAPSQPSATATPGTPPGNGIAVGEPNPNGTAGARPAVSYRVDGGTKLTVYFFGGVCQQYGLKADESHPGRVDVRVVVAAPMTPGQVCNALAKRQSVSTDLRSPLTGRTVTDQSSGQEVPLDADPHIGPDPVTPDVAGR